MPEKRRLKLGTEVTKHDFHHPISIQYHGGGVVLLQGDAMIRVVRDDLPEFLDEITQAIYRVRAMKAPEQDEEVN